jgi:hypothetical protein
MKAGYHVVLWDGQTSTGKAVASGIYICQFRAGSFLSTKKMILIK